MNKNTDPRWLEWAKELQFIAQAGADLLPRSLRHRAF